MSDERNPARTAIALSAVVVAACVVTVTIKVMATDVVTVNQQRVLDQESLERQAARYVRGPEDESRNGVECPTSVEAREGNKFTCRVRDGSNDRTVFVTVTDDQGDISVTTSAD